MNLFQRLARIWALLTYVRRATPDRAGARPYPATSLRSQFPMFATCKHLHKTILIFLIALEGLLSYNFCRREIAWYPPLNFDQAGYLTESYHLEERILAKGFGEVWQSIWTKGHSTGLAFPIEGALSGLFIGGARLPQLLILFVAFCALQIAAFATSSAAWGALAYGYMALGLILCQITPWFWAGGLFDFRIDFLAYSLYGIWICAIIRSKLFLNRNWAIGSGIIGAFLVLNRFLTVVYLIGVATGFAGVCIAIALLWRANRDLTRRMWIRLCNLGLSIGLLAVIVAPILIINREAIHNYYVVGHTVGDEKYLRSRQEGIRSLTDHLLFYPRSILSHHWGSTFLWASAIAIAGGLIARILRRRKAARMRVAEPFNETVVLQIIFLLGSILGPLAVLTADVSKSPVVGGIIGVPSALLVVALTARAAPMLRDPEPMPMRKFVIACSVAIFAMGIWNVIAHLTRHLPEYGQRRDLRQLEELDKWLVNYAADHRLRTPAISFDVISGSLNSGAITATGFEQLGELIEFHPLLGGGIMAVDRSEALSQLENSDFVILTTQPKAGVFPFYEHIAQYWGDLKAWADKHMIAFRTVRFDEFTATVYARPSAVLSGLSGAWVPREGLSITASRTALQRFPVIRLSGATDYSRLPKIPVVSAAVENEAGLLPVPATMRRIDNDYEILIDTSTIELPTSDQVRLQLKFDQFFLAKRSGSNGDERELVVKEPKLVHLIPAGG